MRRLLLGGLVSGFLRGLLLRRALRCLVRGALRCFVSSLLLGGAVGGLPRGLLGGLGGGPLGGFLRRLLLRGAVLRVARGGLLRGALGGVPRRVVGGGAGGRGDLGGVARGLLGGLLRGALRGEAQRLHLRSGGAQRVGDGAGVVNAHAPGHRGDVGARHRGAPLRARQLRVLLEAVEILFEAGDFLGGIHANPPYRGGRRVGTFPARRRPPSAETTPALTARGTPHK